MRIKTLIFMLTLISIFINGMLINNSMHVNCGIYVISNMYADNYCYYSYTLQIRVLQQYV